MNNNMNVGGMGGMPGPVGGAMGMMSNGIPRAQQQRAMPANDPQQRSQLNTYIYEYFLRYEMYDCARAIYKSDQPINLNSPSGNNMEDHSDGDEIKDEMDMKRPNDLPSPNLPRDCPESCFLYEWWCLFWDMFNAQRNKVDGSAVAQYHMHTQQQSRLKQEQHQAILRNKKPDGMTQQQYHTAALMMRNNPAMQTHDLARKAFQNNNRNVNPTPQQIQMMQQAQMNQQKQQQFQREGSEQQRPQTPSMNDGASPAKKLRMEGPQFNATPAMLANVRAQMNPDQQTQVFAQGVQGGMQGGANDGINQMQQRSGAAGNHALQDYQMQLMLLEQQNKRRLMMARQEQDSVTPRDGSMGPGNGPGSNGQPFQANSPQGNRSPGSEAKRGTSQMNNNGISSPAADGNRGSPGPMNFMANGQNLDPNLPQYFKNPMTGAIDANMSGQMANMRPPSSHPGAFANGQMNQQMMANMARQQQAAGQGPGWNGSQTPQGQQNQTAATPRPTGAMPPPSAHTTAVVPPARPTPATEALSPAPPTPVTSQKAAPKKAAATKKRAAKKAAATPGGEGANDVLSTPATPATPLTKGFNPGVNANAQPQNSTGSNSANGSAANAQANSMVPAQPDQSQGGFNLDDNAMFNIPGLTMDFANPQLSGVTDVMPDFDFDSFLHQDNGEENFNFGEFGALEGGEVGVE